MRPTGVSRSSIIFDPGPRTSPTAYSKSKDAHEGQADFVPAAGLCLAKQLFSYPFPTFLFHHRDRFLDIVIRPYAKPKFTLFTGVPSPRGQREVVRNPEERLALSHLLFVSL
jgi:hypothetical protein